MNSAHRARSVTLCGRWDTAFAALFLASDEAN
jgi:hypothetical protein